MSVFIRLKNTAVILNQRRSDWLHDRNKKNVTNQQDSVPVGEHQRQRPKLNIFLSIRLCGSYILALFSTTIALTLSLKFK